MDVTLLSGNYDQNYHRISGRFIDIKCKQN